MKNGGGVAAEEEAMVFVWKEGRKAERDAGLALTVVLKPDSPTPPSPPAPPPQNHSERTPRENR